MSIVQKLDTSRRVSPLWSPRAGTPAGWRLLVSGGKVHLLRPRLATPEVTRPQLHESNQTEIDYLIEVRDIIAGHVKKKYGTEFPRGIRLVDLDTYPGNAMTVWQYNKLTRRLSEITGWKLLPAIPFTRNTGE